MKVLILGHVAIDIKEDGSTLHGGPPNYQVPLLLAAGVEVTVLTSHASDYQFINHHNLEIINIPSKTSTEFVFRQAKSGAERTLYLNKAAAVLTLDGLKRRRFDAIIVSGIAAELTIDTLKELKQYLLAKGKVYLDAQSFTRLFSETGAVEIIPIRPEILNTITPYVDVIKGSTIELLPLIKYIPTSTLLIRTHSGNGLETNLDQVFDVHPMETSAIIDDTGSGDIFLVALVIAGLKGEDIADAIYLAHTIAIAHLKIKGCPTIEQEMQILSNINW